MSAEFRLPIGGLSERSLRGSDLQRWREERAGDRYGLRRSFLSSLREELVSCAWKGLAQYQENTNTPYESMTLPATVTATLLRGKVTARDGKSPV